MHHLRLKSYKINWNMFHYSNKNIFCKRHNLVNDMNRNWAYVSLPRPNMGNSLDSSLVRNKTSFFFLMTEIGNRDKAVEKG